MVYFCMLRVTRMITVCCLLLLLPALSVAGEGNKDEWIDAVTQALPEAFCQDGQYFMSCYEVTQKECRRVSLLVVESCMDSFKGQFPDNFDEESGAHWGEQVGRCAGTAFHIYFEKEGKFRNTEKCNDAGQW